MAEATAAPEATPVNGTSETNGKKNFRNKEREPEVPIEELYDLTKPIPRVEKPNKAAHDAEIAALQAKMDALKAERQAVRDKIKAAQSAEKNTVLFELRTQMNALKTKKNALFDQKKALKANLDQSKASADKIMKDKKDVKSNLKYGSMSEIEAEIKKLQIQQETTTMTLNQEKKLLKEIDALQASKKFIVVVQAKDTAMEDVQMQRKSIQAQIQDKDKEIDVIAKELDAVMKLVKEHNDKDSSAREAMQALFTEVDSFKGKMDEVMKEINASRGVFREQQNAFYQNQRAVRAQKQMLYEEEKKRREAEYAAKQAEFEAEEAKKIPYEEEQALCEFLADYLERTYLGGGGVDQNAASAEPAKKDVVPVTDDPFAGMQAVKGKELAETEIFFGKGKQKKKRIRTPKDTVPFVLSVDTFEQFGMIQLDPPISIDQVPDSVKALREKKAWYKEQPRGSVPTAAEIRKAAAVKSKPAAERVKRTTAAVDLNDFVPLSAAVGTAAASSASNWGKTDRTE